ncbi:MAG: acetylxylan esterase [Paludibacter sp.]|nr:acetylxylan esterase [Paludibacter sp.]
MRKLIFLALCISISAFSFAQIKVEVMPDHTDWLYKIGEKVKLQVNITDNGKLVNNVSINYKIGAEQMTPTIDKTIVLEDGKTVIEAGTLDSCGFLRCKVTAELGSKQYVGLATCGFEPEKIKPITPMPRDFNSFWERNMKDAQKDPLNPQLKLLADRCTDKINVYSVCLPNKKNSSQEVYGVLSTPKAKGKYPAVLELPGAGVRSLSGNIKMAEKGLINFQIEIHGLPMELDSAVYRQFGYGAITSYWKSNLDDKNTYYYKYVLMRTARAVEFLSTLAEYDGVNLAVWGASQGGGLTLMTTALNTKVKCFVAMCPGLCDHYGFSVGRASGWPQFFSDKKQITKEKMETATYFDAVNFVKNIKVPGFIILGYNDVTVPPTTVYAAVNSAKFPLKVYVAKEAGHSLDRDSRIAADEWLLKQFNIK